MKQLIHNGVLIPAKPEWKKLHIFVGDQRTDLTPLQEEMAVAWVKKLGTEYVEQRAFISNFFSDFQKALKLTKRVPPQEFDFSPVIQAVESEKAWKLSLTREEKKQLAAARKRIREANKEK